MAMGLYGVLKVRKCGGVCVVVRTRMVPNFVLFLFCARSRCLLIASGHRYTNAKNNCTTKMKFL